MRRVRGGCRRIWGLSVSRVEWEERKGEDEWGTYCEGAEGSAEISEISMEAIAGRKIREREVRILIINYINKQNGIKTVVKIILQ